MLLLLFTVIIRQKDIKMQSSNLGILLFPVFLSLSNFNIDKYKLYLLEIFGLTCAVVILYLYFDAFHVIHYFHLPLSSIIKPDFLNQNFSAPIGLHATYLSMYATLSIATFLLLYFNNPQLKNLKYIFYILILIIGLVQLSSRSVAVAAGIILVIVVPFLLLGGKKKLQFLIISFAVSLITIAAITQVKSFKERYVNDLENDLSEYVHPGDNLESRALRWKLEWEVIQKSLFIGYGNGSEKYILKEKYFENKFYRSYLLELNAHNQYFSFMINTGIIGLLLYFYVLYFGFATAIKRKDFLFLSFMIIITIVSIPENILDVSKGVLFYSFFYSLFLLTDSKENSQHQTNVI